MSEHTGPADEVAQQQDSPLDRAAAAGPMSWGDSAGADTAGTNVEPAVAHDSPAGAEEERAADPGAPGDELAGPDRMSSIYGPPPGDRS